MGFSDASFKKCWLSLSAASRSGEGVGRGGETYCDPDTQRIRIVTNHRGRTAVVHLTEEKDLAIYGELLRERHRRLFLR